MTCPLFRSVVRVTAHLPTRIFRHSYYHTFQPPRPVPLFRLLPRSCCPAYQPHRTRFWSRAARRQSTVWTETEWGKRLRAAQARPRLRCAGGQAASPHRATILGGSPEEGFRQLACCCPSRASHTPYRGERLAVDGRQLTVGKGVRCSPNPVRLCPVRDRSRKSKLSIVYIYE